MIRPRSDHARPPRGRAGPRGLAVAGFLAACGSGTDANDGAREAWRALERGDGQAAEVALRRALEGDPEHPALLSAAARLYQDPRAPAGLKPRLSLHYALRLEQALPGDPSAPLLSCRALALADQWAEAERACERSRTLGGDAPIALGALDAVRAHRVPPPAP